MRVRASLFIAFVLVLALAAPAQSSDQVPSSQDNPKGCTTATTASDDGCGAQGRNNYNENSAHVPPIKACATKKASSGSVITRILPAGPVRPDKSLAFISGACVYLPPGYDANSSTRYPVVYLLHGGGGDEADWVTFGNVRGILDASYARNHSNAVIAVMPDGRDGNWYDYYNRKFLIETYVLDYLIPYVDRHFRTIADRKGRAIFGLSNGGYGAMEFAAKRPDMFTVAGSMSGNVGAIAMGDLGTPVAKKGPALQQAGTYYYGNEPIDLASNLDNVNLIMDWGAKCAMSDLTTNLCGAWMFEQLFRNDNQTLHKNLLDDHHIGALDYRETEGAHEWKWWTTWLATRDLPFALEHMWKPTSKPGSSVVPATFRYRSIAPSFNMWSYGFAVQKPRASEFLDLTNVRSAGMVATGSGVVFVTTAPRYKPGARFLVKGAGRPDQHITADHSGRLHFVIDMGKAHTNEQYSPPGRALVVVGGYFQTRYVVIAAG